MVVVEPVRVIAHAVEDQADQPAPEQRSHGQGDRRHGQGLRNSDPTDVRGNADLGIDSIGNLAGSAGYVA